uniref:Uncharacterized protein n=1 Tax=Serinus canaria TaxID=9135 RepID=A0A8C9KXI8_SERCA
MVGGRDLHCWEASASWLTWDVPPGALFGFQNHLLRSHTLWSRPEAILVFLRAIDLIQNDLCSLQEAPGGTKSSAAMKCPAPS